MADGGERKINPRRRYLELEDDHALHTCAWGA
jgi:hypothetical protein